MSAPDEQVALAEVSSEVSEVVARARAIEVSSEAEAQDATGFLAEIKAAKTRGERARKFLVDPLNLQVKKINALFKDTAAPLIEADLLVRRKVLAFQQKQQREREREQARLDEERRVAEERAAAERRAAWEEAQRAEREADEAVRAGAADTECDEHAARLRREAEEATQREIAVASAPPPHAAAPAPLATDAGSAAIRREWKATIVDEMRLPRKYLSPNVVAINAAVREGVREIPGVAIEQKAALSVRAR